MSYKGYAVLWSEYEESEERMVVLRSRGELGLYTLMLFKAVKIYECNI